MRVDLECSCGAKLTVSYDVGRAYSMAQSKEAENASKLLDQFRKDHKVCLTSKAASEATEVSGPLEREFTQVRQTLDFLDSCIRSGEPLTETVMAEESDALAALSAIERHLQDMERQATLDGERAAILSSAVGRARLILNDASAETTALIDQALAALPAREKGTE